MTQLLHSMKNFTQFKLYTANRLWHKFAKFSIWLLQQQQHFLSKYRVMLSCRHDFYNFVHYVYSFAHYLYVWRFGVLTVRGNSPLSITRRF